MEPSQELGDLIYRERVMAARRMPPEEKLFAGVRLFEMACRITASGIRAQFPDAEDQKVLEILRERLALRKRMEESA